MGNELLETTRERRSAFSLIEVNVAILVIAGGMLSLFTLFPAGLRLSTAAMSDTRQVFFADEFFSFFEDGVLQIQDRDSWQDIKEFWKAGQEGLEDGFKSIGASATLSDDNWTGDDRVRQRWGGDDLKESDFTKDRDKGHAISLCFRSGSISQHFSKSDRAGNLDAEFVVRIASDYGNGADGLIWRVSLIVSDEGENGWFYDNPVYHRDFRYAELP